MAAYVLAETTVNKSLSLYLCQCYFSWQDSVCWPVLQWSFICVFSFCYVFKKFANLGDLVFY